MNATHRLDDNPAECERLTMAGMTIFRRKFDDDPDMPDGPTRAGPTGLMVSRSLGDAEASEHILATPTISQACQILVILKSPMFLPLVVHLSNDHSLMLSEVRRIASPALQCPFIQPDLKV